MICLSIPRRRYSSSSSSSPWLKQLKQLVRHVEKPKEAAHFPNIPMLKWNPKGVWIIVATLVTGAGILTHQVIAIVHHFSNLLPYEVLNLEKIGPAYAFLDNEDALFQEEVLRKRKGLNKDDSGLEWHTVKSEPPILLHDKYSLAQNYWSLFRKTRSKLVDDRINAVERIAEMEYLHDSQCVQIAQACDRFAAIGLARSKIAKMSLLLPPPRLPESKEPEMERRFRTLLASLPEREIVDCVSYLTQHVMERGHFYHAAGSEGDYYFWSQAGLTGKGIQRVPEETMRIFYLEALLSHSRVPAHRKLIVKLGGLLLLMQIANYQQGKSDVQSLISQILGNLALDSELHEAMFRAGWVKILATWMRSPTIAVSLPAARALANMDRDTVSEVLEDGLYLLHPVYRSTTPEITADVIFVHGLTGGVYKSWRQRDVNPSKPNNDEGIFSNSDAEETENLLAMMPPLASDACIIEKGLLVEKPNIPPPQQQKRPSWFKLLQESGKIPEYTQCWPKDWLVADCPLLRVLAVDFDAQVSQWFQKCPVESEKRTIVSRSNEILDKLIKAGVGKRPIIWITHSMGGLLVKKLLITSSSSSDPRIAQVWENTKGIIFFSVPHRGSQWAIWGTTEFLLLLSTEVQELKYNSPQLLELHVQFKSLVDKANLPVLSFGECKKTNLGLALEALFVSPYSADPGFGKYYSVETDHISICKPVNKHSKVYIHVLEFIYDNIPHTIYDTLMATGLKTIDVDTFLDNYMMW